MIPLPLLAERRKKLAANMTANSCFVLLSGGLMTRNGDVEYLFRQESNFWYLTGFNEPNACLIIKKDHLGQIGEYLFIPQNQKEKEIWLGKKMSIADAKRISGCQEVRELDNWSEQLQSCLVGSDCAYFNQNVSVGNELHTIAASMIHQYQQTSSLLILSVHHLLRPLRLIKDAWEIEQLKQAAEISMQAHREAITRMRSRIKRNDRVWEYQVCADINHHFQYTNTTWAYPPIVATGKNACTLHYVTCQDELMPGDIVLIDAACEYNYYAADITRCYPVSGTFSAEQKAIYQLVLQAQLAGIEEVGRDGATTLSVHEKVVRVLTSGLLDLNILQGALAENIEQRTYWKYFMHGTGHFLGLDVHDVGHYTNEEGKRVVIAFEPGMVVTVEPGLYFAPDDLSIPPKYRGIGIRIEDDVLKTIEGTVVLTSSLVKSLDDIEDLCA